MSAVIPATGVMLALAAVRQGVLAAYAGALAGAVAGAAVRLLATWWLFGAIRSAHEQLTAPAAGGTAVAAHAGAIA